MVFVEGRSSHFGMLAVQPAQQRRGIASALIREAEASCFDAGAQTMRLELLAPKGGGSGAGGLAALYVRHGYMAQRCGQCGNRYRGYETLVPFEITIMTKQLQAPTHKRLLQAPGGRWWRLLRGLHRLEVFTRAKVND